MSSSRNIFADLPGAVKTEFFENLLTTKNFRIERIISHGQASPKDFWYDQDHQEWVLLLAGKARLQLADQHGEIELNPGDYLLISAHQRHRVAWTDPGQPTIWLAIHYE
ncbi:MAG: cupin domain-containing protein [Deltaproteobacteria bacterium]|nr:cupin domain-containing protein [Candidatus Anaeroferrophillus wilburensis]MBN2887947.1 cupin domain-containing protein [Deltaproteobacteria bacterium]